MSLSGYLVMNQSKTGLPTTHETASITTVSLLFAQQKQEKTSDRSSVLEMEKRVCTSPWTPAACLLLTFSNFVVAANGKSSS